MNKFKKKISMAVVIFSILMIFSSPLWASEEIAANDTIVELQGDCEEIEVSNESNVEILQTDQIQNGSFSELNNMVASNTSIELDRNYVFNASTDSKLKEGIAIKKEVVIDGRGFTIDSTSDAKLFDIKSNGKLTLKNIVLLNDNPVSSSGIANAGQLIFDNVTFTTQKQVTSGNLNAAIVNEGSFTVNNSNFVDSIINCTGNGILYVYGLLIKNSGNLAIENTNISNNGIQAYANTVQLQGAMIYNSGVLSLSNVNMSDSFCSIKASLSSIFGFILGTTDNSRILVDSSIFNNNNITNDANTNSAMTNVIRIANGDLTVLNSSFTNNSGSLNGGAIGYYSHNEMIVENSLFDSNSVSIQGGAIFTSGNLRSKNNIFRNNFAGRNGGAIYVYGYYDAGNPELGNVLSINDTFEYNYVVSSPDAYGQASILSWGGAICSKAGNINLTNDTFYRNKAIMGDGGAIANYLSSFLQVSHCIFKENEATRWDVWTHASGLGGAILIPQTEMVDEDNLATFNIEYSIFDNNIAVAGSALYSVPYQDIPCDFTANNNYWCSNNPFFKELIGKYQLSDVVYPDNFIVMDIEANSPVYIDSSNTFKVTLNKVNENGTIRQLDNFLPEYMFNITSTLNPLSASTISIKNGEANFTYGAEKVGSEVFSINKKYYKKEISVVKYDSDLAVSSTNTIEGVLFNISLAGDAGGNVSVKINGGEYKSVVDNGSAFLKVSGLAIGNYEIMISYSGDAKYNEASLKGNITIEKIKQDITFSFSSTIDLSKSDTVAVYMADDAAGRVLFDIGGNNFYANVINGVAKIDVSSLTAGKKVINWKYLGDGKYCAAEGNMSVTVLVKPKITGNKNMAVFYTDGSKYKVRILGSDGKAVGAGKSVTFKINGKSTTAKTDKNGYASLLINQIPKRYTVIVQYGKASVKNSILVKNVLSAKNLVAKKAAKVKYTATVKGKTPFKNKKVTFKINGKVYYGKTNTKGVATVYLKNLKVGKYKVLVSYASVRLTKTVKINK